MADGTKIEWADATWNPITGCSVVSPGCTNCYAMKLAGGRLRHHPSRAGLTTPSKAGPVWNGKISFNENWINQPLHWRAPRDIFVCAHGDLFAENVETWMIDRVWAVMLAAPWHTFMVLTKRPERMRAYVEDILACGWTRLLDIEIDHPSGKSALTSLLDVGALAHPAPNIWLGVSVEDKRRVRRIDELLLCPAAKYFVSIEPLLELPDLTNVTGATHKSSALAHNALTGELWRPAEDGSSAGSLGCCGRRLHWVIVGGESGPRARPIHPDWIRTLRDQCVAAGVAFHFKQWGVWREVDTGDAGTIEIDADGAAAASILEGCVHPGWITEDGVFYDDLAKLPEETRCRLIDRVGKKAAGRVLDGRTWDERAEAAA